MEKTGRKNAAGGWVLGEFLRRIASAGMLFMAVVGIALGFLIRGLPVFEGSVGSRTSWVMLGAMMLAFVVFYAYCRRVDATWGRGLRAERQIGDLIDHGVEPTLVSPAAKFVRCRESTPAESRASRCRSVV